MPGRSRGNDTDVLGPIRASLRPLRSGDGSNDSDVDAIVDAIGDARVVLLGEASHGTHDFYATRAAVTRRLIETKGFRAVTIEGDWPDARRVDRLVRGVSSDGDADEALGNFRRFPRWMWRNGVVRAFVDWMRDWNDARSLEERCSFHGLDLYSLHASIAAVLWYLEEVDPTATERARERYRCFAIGGEDPQLYGYAAARAPIAPCEEEVARQLADLRHCADEYASDGGLLSEDDFFSAEQNARLVANAERYYRSMFQGRVSSWNLRDTHMMETLTAVVDHVERRHGDARVCVWAHNSHLGDASATEMGRRGELNLGQLVREQYGSDACLLGFTTHSGTVAIREALTAPRLERAIGVIYRPQTERQSHYFEASLADQFDLVVHLDETRALVALE